MKSKKDHVKVLLDYWKNYYTDGGFPTVFKLKCEMIEQGICPRCGTKSWSWDSATGHFPCDECDFNLTEWEINEIMDGHKGILNRKLRKKPRKGFMPFTHRVKFNK